MHFFKFYNVFAEFGASNAHPANCPDFLNLSCLFDGAVFPEKKVFSGIKVCTFSGEHLFLGIFICQREMSQYNIVSRSDSSPSVNLQNDFFLTFRAKQVSVINLALSDLNIFSRKLEVILIFFQCHCGHINCPCCNLLMNLEITDPNLLQWPPSDQIDFSCPNCPLSLSAYWATFRVLPIYH